MREPMSALGWQGTFDCRGGFMCLAVKPRSRQRWRTFMLLEHNGATPKIDPTARIAPNAVLCGEVTIVANSSIAFGAVLTAESGSITVGEQLCHYGLREYPQGEKQCC